VAGVLLVILGLLLKDRPGFGSSKIQALETPRPELSQEQAENNKIAVDISGSVNNPGLYYLDLGSRVQDVIDMAHGFSSDVDNEWVDKNLNRAAKLSDGQKIFIPSIQQSGVLSATNFRGDRNVAQHDQSTADSRVNINTASLNQLMDLPGIGQVYGQKIIENRPYSEVDDLVKKQVLKQSTFDKIKGKVSVY